MSLISSFILPWSEGMVSVPLTLKNNISPWSKKVIIKNTDSDDNTAIMGNYVMRETLAV